MTSVTYIKKVASGLIETTFKIYEGDRIQERLSIGTYAREFSPTYTCLGRYIRP